MRNIRTAIIITCHNRVKTTIRCLDALSHQALPTEMQTEIYLVDDGSTDNTKHIVKQNFPQVQLVEGTGDLYWNRGMHLGFSIACSKKYDFYMWLNDDAHLNKNAISSLYSIYQTQENNHKQCIVVGSVQDPETLDLVYGGFRKKAFRPLSFDRVKPISVAQKCDTMSGTCVFIPAPIVKDIGLIDPSFIHYFGDIDYGLRATAKGYDIWISPGYAGTCVRNSVRGTWEDRSLSMKERFSRIRDIKGLYPPDWRRFAKRYAGIFWPCYYVFPYIKLVLTSIRVK